MTSEPIHNTHGPLVAYFCAEYMLKPRFYTYAGGLGALAGDHIRSSADNEVPLCGVGMLWHQGYFRQQIEGGRQIEYPEAYNPWDYVKPIDGAITVPVEGRDVVVGNTRYTETGVTGHNVDVNFLTTYGLNNRSPCDNFITSNLYYGPWRCWGDQRDAGHKYHRLTQDIVLGIGGLRWLHKLGIEPEVYHFNEAHAFLGAAELAKIYGLEKAMEMIVFTSHTPIAAGNDHFSYSLVEQVLPGYFNGFPLRELAGEQDLSTTQFMMNMSRSKNGVSERHEYIGRKVWPGFDFNHVTNGVHNIWVNPRFRELYDTYDPLWVINPMRIGAISKEMKPEEQRQAREGARQDAADFVQDRYGIRVSPDRKIIRVDSRLDDYKRQDLFAGHEDELTEICRGEVMFQFAGKPHWASWWGKEMIRRIFDMKERLKGRVDVDFYQGYDMDVAMNLVAGARTAWGHFALQPSESCYTSGMKANSNQVPQFTTINGHVWELLHSEHGNGRERMADRRRGAWSFGPDATDEEIMLISMGRENPTRREWDERDARDGLRVLRNEVLPGLEDEGVMDMMGREALENFVYMNSHRMVREYCEKIYQIAIPSIESLEQKLALMLKDKSQVLA